MEEETASKDIVWEKKIYFQLKQNLTSAPSCLLVLPHTFFTFLSSSCPEAFPDFDILLFIF